MARYTVSPYHLALICGLMALVVCALAYSLRVLHARLEQKDRLIDDYAHREAERARFCAAYGHHIDEMCRCTRCLTEQHAYELIDSQRTCLGSELVNPNADPGALYLSADFQPDADYGKTQTVYRVERTYRCSRCAKEKTTVDEEKVLDQD
jgi:hypothetical protein